MKQDATESAAHVGTERRSIDATALPSKGRCEAWDLVPTEDDADYVQCVNRGVRVVERLCTGGFRTRIACAVHRSLVDGVLT